MTQKRQGERPVFAKKMKRALCFPLKWPLYILALTALAVIRLIRPCLLVRWRSLNSGRIGHFAGNTELYLCERDAGMNVPQQRHVDLFFEGKPVCNQQLATMWKRVLRVWPGWIEASLSRVNLLIPGGKVHEIGNNTQHDRDVHNLFDRFPPHLEFTPEEEVLGQAGLRAIGIPPETPFVCLIVRDSAYLWSQQRRDWNYHNYRDSDIQNYVLAAEELAARGYFVLRMGAEVKTALESVHSKVIDYATNGMRSDFMDIYLGAKCTFCISVGTGFDAVPQIFRRPIAYVNMVPLGYLNTFGSHFIGITKHHCVDRGKRELTLREIFSQDVGFPLHTYDYEAKGIKLVGNTPEEIRDVAIEMAERLNGTWQPNQEDEELQKRFWDIFPTNALEARNKRPLHGEIRGRFGAAFLSNNCWWLE